MSDMFDTLEAEVAGLRRDLEAVRAERDGLGRLVHDKAVMIMRMEAELEALAAHVERLREALTLAKDRIDLLASVATSNGASVYAAHDIWPEEMEQTLAETPYTSLARLKAIARAEAMEWAAEKAAPSVAPWLKALARDYRRQAGDE